MNILYIGSSGALSLVPFYELLLSSYPVSAVAVDKPINFQNKIIALENESLALAANQKDVPVLDLSEPSADFVNRLSEYTIDVILMSCYSKRLPDEIVKLAGIGCYNMHPSLLPRYRGPEPIFWQMKQANKVGVSWHRVSDEFDAGDIALQKEVMLEDGLNHSEISRLIAETGAELMLELLTGLASGKQVLMPQDPVDASYYSYPQKHDFVIDDRCTAQQVYNFICATRVFSEPYLFKHDKDCFYIDSALAYDNERHLETAKVEDGNLYIPCNEGVLITTFTDKITT